MILECYGNREKKKENVKLGNDKTNLTSAQIIKTNFHFRNGMKENKMKIIL